MIEDSSKVFENNWPPTLTYFPTSYSHVSRACYRLQVRHRFACHRLHDCLSTKVNKNKKSHLNSKIHLHKDLCYRHTDMIQRCYNSQLVCHTPPGSPDIHLCLKSKQQHSLEGVFILKSRNMAKLRNGTPDKNLCGIYVSVRVNSYNY